jgi:hypothetical protein
MRSEMRWLVGAIDLAVEAMPPRVVNDQPLILQLSLRILRSAFERGTGKRATLTTHKNGEYLGRPISPFGEFVVAFFGEVDPQLTPTRLATSLRHILRGDRSPKVQITRGSSPKKRR